MTLTTLRLSRSSLQVAWRDHGAGAPVLLIHGVGMQSAAWGPQIEALSDRYRIIAVDMPGHGESAALPQGSQLPEYVCWLHDFADQLGLGSLSIVGHSMGALIAGGFAVQYPQLTRRVALLNGVFRRDAKARIAVGSRADQIRSGNIDLETPLKRWFGDTPSDQAARAKVADWLSVVHQAGYATAYEAFARGDDIYADRFAEINCPFLAITGEDDPNSTPEMSKEMAATVKDGTAIVVENHRHMVNLTAPGLVTQHLKNWLQDTPYEEAVG
ncbi:hydrolase [Tateyamaria omphalii]|uniref:alpha/beta fold hydrolase n=1 Tax=Tateyamaria omphalii TaxID=299262 RepID=UPI0016799920|nr:alpha/beta hydrolase [Tateyamaria omphalii]GGX59586.1 hydrolase [Tateyamaria omphalii]